MKVNIPLANLYNFYSQNLSKFLDLISNMAQPDSTVMCRSLQLIKSFVPSENRYRLSHNFSEADPA